MMKAFRSKFFACLIAISAQIITNVAIAKPLAQPSLVTATGPLRVLSSNGRYFTDGSGKAIFLTGSHTWDNRQDLGSSSFDYANYLSQLQTYHHNFFRFWVWEQPRGITTSPDPAQPNATLTPEIFKRTGPGTAADGGLKFDVTQYNQVFFDRLRQRVIDAGNQGMYVSVMVFDGWSVEQKGGGTNPWLYHPFNKNNNVNGLNGDPNGDQSGAETQTLQISAITTMQEAYVRKVIDTVNDLDNVLYEVSNESDAGSTAWEYHMIAYIHSYEAGKAKQHPVGMTYQYPGGSNTDLFASPADWISPNGSGGYDSAPPVAAGSKVVVLDTDHIWGIGGDRAWAWKSFTRGYNLLYMDPWNGTFIPVSANVDLRRNLGYIRTYAERMNLVAMTPQPSLCSSGFCLANNSSTTPEFLAYLPTGGTVTMNLSVTSKTLTVEWFNPATAATSNGGTISGGANRQLTSPFSGDAVLYLHSSSTSPTPTPTPIPTQAPLSKDSAGVFRPSNGLLYLKNSNTTGIADVAINYGLPGDYPVVGDWDGNGTATIGIYRNGTFYLRNSNTIGFANIVFAFGQVGDQPIAGDWDGNGTDTIGVYRPSTGQFLLRNSNSAGPANLSFYLGNVGDVGIAGDWTNKGFDTVGVFRPSNGIIFLKNSNTTGFADIALNYGIPGDKPVVGDWDNNGTDTIGVYRNGQFMLRNSNTVGFADMVFGLGNPGDIPIAGNWDGLP